MEFIVGPLLALIIGIKYSDIKNKKNIKDLETIKAEMSARVEAVEGSVNNVDKEILKKTLQIVMPIAQATQRLQDEVGVK